MCHTIYMYIYIHIRCSQKTWMKSLRKSLHYLLNLKLFLKSLFFKESISHKWPQYAQVNTHTYTHTLRMIVICFSGEDFDLDQSLLWELRDTINISSVLPFQGTEGPHLPLLSFCSQKEYSPQAIFHNENEKQRLNGSGK